MNAPIPENLIDQLLNNVRQQEISASQAIKYIDQVLSTFRRIGLSGQEETYVLRMLENIGESYEVLGSLEKAQELYEEAIDLAQTQEDDTKCADLYWKLGRVFRKRNQWTQALDYIAQSRRHYESVQDSRGIGRTWNSEGLVQSSLGKYTEAFDAYNLAISLAQQVNDDQITSDASVNLGILASIQGDFDRALLLFQNSIPYYEQLDKPISIARTYHNMGMCQTARGIWHEALDAFEKSIEIAQDKGDLILTALNIVHKAAVYLELNDRTLVATYCARALDTFKEVDYPLGIAETYKILGRLYTQKQDWATAHGLFSESLRLCQQYQKPLGLAEVERELGNLYLAQNNSEMAREILQSALDRFKTLGAQNDISKTEEILKNI